MSGEDANTPIQRLVVLLDCTAASRAAAERAGEIAARSDAELLGLFVENEDLVRSAGLPFGREIGLTTGRIRRFEVSEIEHDLKRQTAQVRTLLERIGRRYAIRYRLEVSRGRPETAAREATTPQDLLVIGRIGWQRQGFGAHTPATRRLAIGANCSVLIVGEERPQPRVGHRPVLVLLEDSLGGIGALRAGALLARDSGEPLVVLLTDLASQEDLAQLARKWAEREGTLLRFVQPQRDDALTLVRVLHRERGAALVLGRHSRAMRSEAGRDLLDEIDVPVVVVP